MVSYSDDLDFEFLIELGNAVESIDPNVKALTMSTSQRRFGVKAGKAAMEKGIHAGRTHIGTR